MTKSRTHRRLPPLDEALMRREFDEHGSQSTRSRAPLAESQKRTEASLVRFTHDEFRTVTNRARECGLPPARFIREAALGAVPKARRAAASSEVIRQLSRIGVDLRRLSDAVREPGEAHEFSALDGVIAEVLEAIRRVE